MPAPGVTEIFLAAPPGLEEVLADEVREQGFTGAAVLPGGVAVTGGWPEIWRANLDLRGASRVLARIGAFRAFHLAQLDKRARRFPWAETLRPDTDVKVEVTCRRSKIYHAGAAAQRIAAAVRESLGAPVAPSADAAPLRLLARIDDNLVSLSVDTSGEPLHRRGHKLDVGKAPMRETLAALFLRQCGYDGTEPVVDPMCGSGTFVIEAAERACGLAPGRGRGFAFERLASFDPAAWQAMRGAPRGAETALRFHGFDRDAGAVAASRANAARAGVGFCTSFGQQPVGALAPPDGPPGLVMVNPPYGGRIGDRRRLHALYGSLGKVLADRFAGWRVGLVTSEPGLARATGLPFGPPGPPVPVGGMRVTLHRTDRLA